MGIKIVRANSIAVYIHPLQNEIANVLHDTEQNGWSGYISKIYFGEVPAHVGFTEAALFIESRGRREQLFASGRRTPQSR